MKVQTWGQAWHAEMQHSGDNCCPICRDPSLAGSNFNDTFKVLIVGFEHCSPKPKAIFRCPSCNILFWFHLHPDHSKFLLKDLN